MTKLIVLEGLDCAGKTTSAKGLVERLEEDGQNAIYNKADSILSTEFDSGLAYLSDLLLSEHAIIQPSLKDSIVVQDRYFFSILSYNAAITGSRKLGTAERLFTKPGIVFYLHANDKTREKRWEESGRKGFPLAFEDLELARKIDGEYRRILSRYNTHFVDTTNISVQQTVENLYKKLMKTEERK